MDRTFSLVSTAGTWQRFTTFAAHPAVAGSRSCPASWAGPPRHSHTGGSIACRDAAVDHQLHDASRKERERSTEECDTDQINYCVEEHVAYRG